MWRRRVLALIQEQFEAGVLKLPKTLQHINTPQEFAAWLSPLYQKPSRRPSQQTLRQSSSQYPIPRPLFKKTAHE